METQTKETEDFLIKHNINLDTLILNIKDNYKDYKFLVENSLNA